MAKLSKGEAIKLIGLYKALVKKGRMSQDLYDSLTQNIKIK